MTPARGLEGARLVGEERLATSWDGGVWNECPRMTVRLLQQATGHVLLTKTETVLSGCS